MSATCICGGDILCERCAPGIARALLEREEDEVSEWLLDLCESAYVRGVEDGLKRLFEELAEVIEQQSEVPHRLGVVARCMEAFHELRARP